MTLHFCDSSVEVDGERLCYVNSFPDGEMDDCGPVGEWPCHDWAACLCLNLYVALGLCRAYLKGCDDGWERAHEWH